MFLLGIGINIMEFKEFVDNHERLNDLSREELIEMVIVYNHIYHGVLKKFRDGAERKINECNEDMQMAESLLKEIEEIKQTLLKGVEELKQKGDNLQ